MMGDGEFPPNSLITGDTDSWLEIFTLNDLIQNPQKDTPNTNLPVGMLSLKERLMRAFCSLISMIIETSLLIQIWVPVSIGVKICLTTTDQPFLYDSRSTSLASYRDFSVQYQLSADNDSKELLGLPGRVYLGKMADWTPDVGFFGEDECPRLNHARSCNVRGSVALPVFNKEGGNCLAVVEIVTTTQKFSYRQEVHAVRKALEAVDLWSSEIFIPSKEKGGTEPHSRELSKISQILNTICDEFKLPLGQTWAPCTQTRKYMHSYSSKNTQRVSVVHNACYVRDQRVFYFHEACSETYLLKRQGVVGETFETNQPCYTNDVTKYSKAEYPLSHHAKIFELRGALAIPIQSSHKSYVLEFFLPIESRDPGEIFQFYVQMLEKLNMMVHKSDILFFPKDQQKNDLGFESWIGNERMISFEKPEVINRECSSSNAKGLAGSSSERKNYSVSQQLGKRSKIQRAITRGKGVVGVCPPTLSWNVRTTSSNPFATTPLGNQGGLQINFAPMSNFSGHTLSGLGGGTSDQIINTSPEIRTMMQSQEHLHALSTLEIMQQIETLQQILSWR